jgi:rhodanese-related sulfurtransferase
MQLFEPSLHCLNANQVYLMLDSEVEWALLDVREEGAFDTGHPFWAVNVPLSHIESRIPGLVPRLGTPLVVLDDADDGLASRAAKCLSAMGYTDIHVLEEGLAGWRKAGLPIHAGIYVPSKAFGEYVEHHYKTPSISVERLKVALEQSEDMVVIDCRPFEEFTTSSLPGSINCPGVELITRVYSLLENEKTTVVVHCAGRTRGIIGAQTLINAGLRNPVVTVENGMAGWLLSGQPLAHGGANVAPAPTLESLQKAFEATQRLADAVGLRTIHANQLREWRQDTSRTLYLFDVRTPQEYEAGHIPEARSAPGGQLLQAFDTFVGTRNSRIVLVDDNCIRARITGFWLRQMGLEDVAILEGASGLVRNRLASTKENSPRVHEPLGVMVSEINVLQLHQLMAEGNAVVLDFSDSLKFGRGHIPGAWFAVRARIAEALSKIPPGLQLVLTSEDGNFAALAYSDVKQISSTPVSVLRGGNSAWSMAGLPMESGRERLTTKNDDVWYSPIDRPDPIQAIHNYLDWETELIDRIQQERGVRFGHLKVE